MATISENPNLNDFQAFVKEMEQERGFNTDTLLQKCLLLGEEYGELARAIRKLEKMKVDDNSDTVKASHELADMFIVMCTIANRLGIDFETAIREKEELNKQRTWK
jgi:NTP pyrophosphatase (non-canonical NTP hydrolase)